MKQLLSCIRAVPYIHETLAEDAYVHACAFRHETLNADIRVRVRAYLL